ncbi:MAG: MBL fold metallo-hydrolase [Deltaproteobacteria bacterium]|jgi:glyoxylase-like metal-dependent hydrolase (beta-lactamase superfamily II)|nr:MBL fold metallo-hydrolase [Deltaproteobacteria bacterium]
MPQLQFAHFFLGPLATNCYLMHDGKEAVVFDPGGSPEKVLDYLKKNKLGLTAIYNTHLHFDHVTGNHALATASQAPIYANERDAYLMPDNRQASILYGVPPVEDFAFQNLDEGARTVLGTEMRVLATPGHTPGSLSYYLPEYRTVICGDVLFHGDIGRTDFKGGDYPTLEKSIREKLYTLPEDTRVCPGHEEETSIGEEKLYNNYVKA